MKRIVLFGGTGFIGNRLCSLLTSQGHDVVCFGRSSIDFHDFKTWKHLIQEGDYVINLVTLHLSKNSPLISEEIHLKALAELARVCVNKKVKNFLYLSSGGSVYGRSDKAFGETDDPKPVSPYGLLKLQSEKLLESYQDRFDLPLSIARPSNIYGETQSETASVGVVTNFYNRIANNIPLDVYGDLEISKDYLHVDDLAIGLGLICTEHKTGIYNLGFGQNHTLKEIIQKIEVLLKKKASLNFHPLKDTDIHSYALNCNKARIELGFIPNIGLDEGINRYFQKGLK